MSIHFRRRTLTLSLVAAAALVACGGGSDSGTNPLKIPAAPLGVGHAETAPSADAASAPPFVDNASSNQRGDARYATLQTNAGVRVLAPFLDLWQPRSLLVDAGQSASANGDFPAVTPSDWSGMPGDASDGLVLNAQVHAANIQYVVDATSKRTAAQELQAYLDDRRGKGYSVTDGLGPLTEAWRSAAQQTTTISAIPVDAATVKYDDKGNNIGVGGSANTGFGAVVDFVGNIGENGSTEPAKRFYKYARPWRWSSEVKVPPSLEPVKSPTPATDGGFLSGHAAEATRDVIAMAYLVPERYQELLLRGLELGEYRIFAGMHSPLDVIGGRIQAQAVAAASLTTGANAVGTRRTDAYQQAHAALMPAVGASSPAAFYDFAHSQGREVDRFADHDANKAEYLRRLTYGLPPIGDTTQVARVPKGAEVLLETRLPYLDDAQRRVVLKTTALPSGYPLMDDAEGWGRLNLFAAADGYGAFNGDVAVNMDASLGGFHALDHWRNDIAGPGKLSKLGSGTLVLVGQNSYSGGTELKSGTLQADSVNALGTGDVHVSGGTLACSGPSSVVVGGAYTQLANTTLSLTLGGGSAGRLEVHGTATLAGGTLKITLRPGFVPAVGDSLAVVSTTQLAGRFDAITVEGFKVTPTYGATGLTLHIDG